MDKKRISAVLIAVGLIAIGFGAYAEAKGITLRKKPTAAGMFPPRVEGPVDPGESVSASFSVNLHEGAGTKSWKATVDGGRVASGAISGGGTHDVSFYFTAPSEPGFHTLTVYVEDVYEAGYDVSFEVLDPTKEKYTLQLYWKPRTAGGIAQSPSPIDINPSPTGENIGGEILEYTEGTEVTLTAVPESGWNFDHWEGGVSGTENPTTLTVNRNYDNITAVFKTDMTTHTLSWEIAQGKGEVITEEVTAGYRVFKEGTEVKVYVDPADGYNFDHWGDDAHGTGHPISLVMDEDKHLEVYFSSEKVVENHVLTTKARGEGTVTPSGETVFREGKKVTVEAEPAEGWKFIGWKGDYTSSENPLSITMTSDKSITAVFKRGNPYTVTLTAKTLPVNGGSVGIAQSKNLQVRKGNKIALQAYPNEGWNFEKWTDRRGNLISRGRAIELTIEKDRTVIAHFEEESSVKKTVKKNIGLISIISGLSISLIGGVMRFTPVL